MPPPDARDRLREAAALWSIGAISSADVTACACDVLVAGLDAPSLRILAGLTRSEVVCAAAWPAGKPRRGP